MRAPGWRAIDSWAILALVALAVASSAAAAAPPVATSPLEDMTLETGAAIVGASDLRDHFQSVNGEPLTYRVEALDPDGAPAAAVEVSTQGARLDVGTRSTTWIGSRTFRIVACAGPSAADCSAGNPFVVHVNPATFEHVAMNPPAFRITISGDAAGAPLQFTLEADVASTIVGDPKWYLDGEFLDEGTSVSLSGLLSGSHAVEVRFETGEGSVVVTRAIEGRANPPVQGDRSGMPWTLAAGIGIIGLGAASASRARVRRPLVFLLVGMIYGGAEKESILDHFRRGALHQIITENPGIHFGELRRRARIPHGSAVHHLRALEKAGIVHAVASGGFTRYFAAIEDVDEAAYHLSPADNALLAKVRQNPGISLRDLAVALDRSRGNTSSSVTRLANLGFVATQNSGRRRLIFPRPPEDRKLQPSHLSSLTQPQSEGDGRP